MTTIRLDNDLTTQVTNYYIEIYSARIVEQMQKSVTKINIPKDQGEWINGPEPVAQDFLEIDRKFTITGFITLDSNKTSIYGASPSVAAYVVKDAMIDMMEKGGVLQLWIGTTGDGYASDRTYNVVVDRINFTEDAEDSALPEVYSIQMECTVGENL